MKYISLLLCFVPLFVFGQAKYEREYRIKAEEVPAKALAFVQALQLDKKVKWYWEEGLDTNSIEAKVKLKGRRISIEFSADGTIEDIEFQLKKLDDPIKTSIRKALDHKYGKYKIRKIQQQVTNLSIGPIQDIMTEMERKPSIIKYELVVLAKIDKIYQQYELLFSHQGELLKERFILLNNTDFLEY